MYAYIENSAFVRWVDLRTDYPNMSFPDNISVSSLPDGIVCVEDTKAPVVAERFKVCEQLNHPIFEENKWRIGFSVRDMDEREISEKTEIEAIAARAQRNQILTDSDWTQAKDIPDEVSSAWQPYRQALRDITTQPGFPFEIAWPVKPE